mmetsp:Transcript_10232/g.32569  ORF Transcript_10232/g.32569 Transcript_10232/m.32569 type:complete len:493 (+) Transcript_10232:165-1643(+)
MLGFHHGPLELEGGGELLIEHRKVAREDGKLLDTGGVAGNDRAVRVDGLDCVSDPLDPRFILACPGHRRDARADVQHIRIKHISSWQLASCPFCLERNQGNVELALVADHDKVGHACGLGLDEVLHRDRGDVLTANADDELLVPAGNVEHVDAGAGALVTRVKVAVAVDRLGVLGLNLRDVLFAKARVRVVAHHDVAATVAELALLFLGGVARVGGAGALGLDVHVLVVHLEHADLGAGEGLAHAAPEAALVVVAGGAATALAHAVHVVDADAEAGKVLLQLARHGRRAGDGELAGIEAEHCLDLHKDLVVDGVVHGRLDARAAELAVLLVLVALLLGEGGDLLLEALGAGACCADLLGNLLPDAGNAEEGSGADRLEALAERARLEVVGAREEDGDVGLALRAGLHRQENVDVDARNVGERQVGEDPFLAADAKVLDGVHGYVRCELEVVVREHDRLGAAGGARGEDEGSALARVLGGDAGIKLLVSDAAA